jgi:hypothetical protein
MKIFYLILLFVSLSVNFSLLWKRDDVKSVELPKEDAVILFLMSLKNEKYQCNERNLRNMNYIANNLKMSYWSCITEMEERDLTIDEALSAVNFCQATGCSKEEILKWQAIVLDYLGKGIMMRGVR